MQLHKKVKLIELGHQEALYTSASSDFALQQQLHLSKIVSHPSDLT